MRRHLWLIAAIILMTVLGIVHFCLEWHAEKQWEHYAAEARAHGVKLMFPDLALPPIPDAQNFAALPMMQKAFHSQPSPMLLYRRHEDEAFNLPFLAYDGFTYTTGGGRDPLGFEARGEGEEKRWEDIADSFRTAKFIPKSSGDAVRDVLAAMERYTPEFQQWSQWRQRPQCRFPYEWRTVPSYADPVLESFSNAANVFALRLRAHLALGDSAAAGADFLEGIQAYHESREEPAMESACNRLSIARVLSDAIGAGLRQRAWDDGQLQMIQAELERIRTWDDYRFALVSERAVINSRVETMLHASMRERSRIRNMHRPPLPLLGDVVANLTPRRVFRESLLQKNQYVDALLAQLDATKPDDDFSGTTLSSSGVNSTSFGGFLQHMNSLDEDDFARLERSSTMQQSLLDQGRLACAVERYRLAHGVYPAALAELAPQLIAQLPNDPYARRPYHYQRTDDGTFLLYGVGANRTDDGGLTMPNLPESMEPDAVWPFAPPATSGKK